ncbi:MAG: sulfotransferase [Cyanobacteria bacterium J06628_6]
MSNVTYPKLFVVGCPRSGTSWVTSLIAGHPEVVAVPVETHAYRLIYEPFLTLPDQPLAHRLRSWKGILRRYGPKPLLLGFAPADIWRGILRDYDILNHPHSHGLHGLANTADFRVLVAAAQKNSKLASVQAEDLIQLLLDRFFQQQNCPGLTLLEKTPLHIRYVDRILQRFPDAKVVEVIRDGRDVCASYNALATTQPWANIGTAGAIRQWRRCIDWGERYRAQSDLSPRIHAVRYEDLKSDTAASLKHLFDFANLSWNDAQISHIVRATDINSIRRRGKGQYVRKGAVGDWKQSLSPEDISLCQEIAGDRLADLGYSETRIPVQSI